MQTCVVIVTVSTTLRPATDLGFLLHKHPDKAQSFGVAVGTAHVVWPEATSERSTVALVLEVDPIALVRGRDNRGAEGFSLAQYVNDRPYAASSMLSVALGKVFRTAMAGRCDARPQLVDQLLPLEIRVPALPSRGGPELVERLFTPLGWKVEVVPIPLDPNVPAWGDSRYVDLRLTGEVRLADALTQLYVLLPVLDDSKHYWVSVDEIDKLLRAGSRWLAGHPERDLITRRYLRHQRELVLTAVGRLAEIDDAEPEQLDNAVPDELPAVDGPAASAGSVDPAGSSTPDASGSADAPAPADAPDRGDVPDSAGTVDSTGTVDSVGTVDSAGRSDRRGEPETVPTPLVELRKGAVLAALGSEGATSVVDLGCGEGALLRELIRNPTFTRVLGVDVSARALQFAARRLNLDRMPDSQRARLQLIQSSATYRDDRLAGYDAVVLMEVVEHVDPPRLPALERSVFHYARPASVIVTTPNVEYNVRFESLPAGTLRHRDHRFEWTRAQFRAWAAAVADTHGYLVRHLPVGAEDPRLGPPTQLAIFRRVG